MTQLKLIADSVNLNFRSSELDTHDVSPLQTKGHFISITKELIEDAYKAIASGVSWDDFKTQFPELEVKENLLIYKAPHTSTRIVETYGKDDTLKQTSYSFLSMNINSVDNVKIRLNKRPFDTTKAGSWVFTRITNVSLRAFYIAEDFKSENLSEKYARMVQYSNHMIDTSVTLFNENATADYYHAIEKGRFPAIDTFKAYAIEITNPPDPSKFEEYTKWSNEKYTILDTKAHNKEFKKRLNAAVKEALKNNVADQELEFYTSRYHSKEVTLALKRNRKPFIQCNADNSPSRHNYSITLLSAETANWQVFLRAHLNLMNQNDRRTYIKELENLDINIADLLLGICLRIENPSKNHYFGSIPLIGKVVSESIFRKEIEEYLISMIADNSLDDYNRVLMYYLLKNYVHQVKDADEKIRCEVLLENSNNSLPAYLVEKL
ncbi:MAG: hypothetical protein ACJAWV_000270 [Flammeovirgaceae bacterium]|jgi:hypothetical protein